MTPAPPTVHVPSTRNMPARRAAAHVRPGRLAWLILLLASIAWSGCGDDLTQAPPVDLPFTLYGVVNPKADTQAVIVFPIESGVLEPIGPEPLDAVVRSRDLETGETRMWRDSVVSDGERGYSHIYWADFRAEFGHRYEIGVERSDGEATAVTVEVPRLITVMEADAGTSEMEVAFRDGAFRVVNIDLTYELGLANASPMACPDLPLRFKYTFSYAGRELRGEDGWDLVVDLQQYVRLMELLAMEETGNNLLFANPRTRLALLGLHLRMTVGDEAWDLPRGFLDNRILSHPGTLTNVENGLGFIGAGYRHAKRLRPSTEAVEDGGFYDFLPGREGCEEPDL